MTLSSTLMRAEQRQVLEGAADAEVGDAVARHARAASAPANAMLAAVALVEARQAVEQRGLAGAVRTDQADDLPVRRRRTTRRRARRCRRSARPRPARAAAARAFLRNAHLLLRGLRCVLRRIVGQCFGASQERWSRKIPARELDARLPAGRGGDRARDHFRPHPPGRPARHRGRAGQAVRRQPLHRARRHPPARAGRAGAARLQPPPVGRPAALRPPRDAA